MADINVERKNSGGRSFLPWILGLIVLALLIWGLSRLLGGNDDETTTTTTTDTTVTTETMPVSGDPAATGTTAPMGAAGAATMPMDSAAGTTGTSPQLTGAVDSAGGDTVAEGRLGNP